MAMTTWRLLDKFHIVRERYETLEVTAECKEQRLSDGQVHKSKKPQRLRQGFYSIKIISYQIFTRFSGAKYNESVGLMLKAS